jgi:hypothetical protein
MTAAAVSESSVSARNCVDGQTMSLPQLGIQELPLSPLESVMKAAVSESSDI